MQSSSTAALQHGPLLCTLRRGLLLQSMVARRKEEAGAQKRVAEALLQMQRKRRRSGSSSRRIAFATYLFAKPEAIGVRPCFSPTESNRRQSRSASSCKTYSVGVLRLIANKHKREAAAVYLLSYYLQSRRCMAALHRFFCFSAAKQLCCSTASVRAAKQRKNQPSQKLLQQKRG